MVAMASMSRPSELIASTHSLSVVTGWNHAGSLAAGPFSLIQFRVWTIIATELIIETTKSVAISSQSGFSFKSAGLLSGIVRSVLVSEGDFSAAS